MYFRKTCLKVIFGLGFLSLLSVQAIDTPRNAEIQEDWLRQTEAWKPKVIPTQADAAGAVDGIKDGKYAFHTGQEPFPWWQVDLGQPTPIQKIVIYNRLDYAPGLHNADNLLVYKSDDGKKWDLIFENPGKYFGGIGNVGPLVIEFENGKVKTRFVRLKIKNPKPVFFHLDEVEIYGFESNRNLALHCPADQSSTSIWSTVKKTRLDRNDEFPTTTISHFLEIGMRLALNLEGMGIDVKKACRTLESAADRLKQLSGKLSQEEQRQLYFAVRWEVRNLAFLDPLLNFEKLLIVKRFCQETYPDVCLNHMPWVSKPGGDLCILSLSRHDEKPGIKNVLEGLLGPGHVHGADLSWDAKRIVFGYAKSKTSNPPDGWLDRTKSFDLRRQVEPIHIYEIKVDGTGLKQLTDSKDWSDLDPAYAPNGDIVFVSERCGTSLQCNEYDKDETSCNIYVMKSDGSDMYRLSVSKDGDYLPHILDDGSIAYTRWEYHERSWAYIQSIWTVHPDGTTADAIFKQHFVDPWALEDIRSIPGSIKLAGVAAGHHTLAAGPVVVVNHSSGINDPKAISIVTPGVVPPEGGMDGVPVPGGGVRDQGGYYMHPWPLSENLFLTSYSYGTGKSGLTSEIDPQGYAIYLISSEGVKELIYRDPSISCFSPIPLRPRLRPPVITKLTDPSIGYATCLVSQVSYGVDGVDPNKIRYLRISEPVGWPFDNERGGQRYGEDHRYGGQDAHYKNLLSWTPIRVLGDVPVESDGSAHFRVPVDTAVYFQLLDENRMELRRMRSFISFQGGEVRACTGCHESRAVAPISGKVPLASLREASEPTPPPWGSRAISFLRDVQPVFNQHCTQCHQGIRPAGGLDFSPGLTTHDSEIADYGYNRAYETLIKSNLVNISVVRMQDASITPPLAYGSLRSKLIHTLNGNAHQARVKLSKEEMLRLCIWIDANAPYHDNFVNKRANQPGYSLPNDKQLIAGLQDIHSRRCAQCHPSAEITRVEWINMKEPENSLFLCAPLATDAGGKGKCKQPTYQNTQDPDYQKALGLVRSAVQKAIQNPRRDLVVLHSKD